MISKLKNVLLGDYSEVGLKNKATRQVWISAVLKSIPEGESILDAGAGECQYRSLCSHLDYTAQDFAQYDGGGDGNGIQTGTWDNSKLDIVSDIASIPVEEGRFDNVLCSEVLEHVPDPVRVFRELHRVLKPGGRLIITAPFASLTHFSPYHFASGLNVYFYEHWSKELNMHVDEVSYNGNYFEFLAQEVWYADTVAKKYGGKHIPLLADLGRKLFLSWLKRSSHQMQESQELMAFGICFIGRKVA